MTRTLRKDSPETTPNFGKIPLADFEWHFKTNVTTNFAFFWLSYTPPHSGAQKCGKLARCAPARRWTHIHTRARQKSQSFFHRHH